MILSLGILIVVAISLIIYTWKRRHLHILAWQLNGRAGYPFIGVGYLFLNPDKVIENMNWHGETYGNMSKIWLGNRLIVYVDEPAQVDVVLNSAACLNKGDSYKYVQEFLGNGLITSQVTEWRHHRKLLNPSFSYVVTGKYTPIFNKHIRTLVQNLRAFSGGSAFDIHAPLKDFSMDSIGETTMDRVMNAQCGENTEYISAIHNCLEIAGVRIFNPVLQSDFLFKMSKYYKSQQDSIQVCKNMLEDIVMSKTEILKSGPMNAKQRDSETFYGKEKHIFIDRVLNLVYQDKSFTKGEAMNETSNVLLAGYETTATTLSFVMLMLAMHPDLQQRVYDECKSLITELAGGDITNDSIANLKYLEMFIKETLRLFPAVPFLTRATTSELVVGDKKLPAGVEIVVNCMRLHRSPEHYANPEIFDPDHFLPESILKRHPYSFVPFSAGPRSCIGTRYAMNIMKIAVIHMIRDYRFKTTMKLADLNFRMNITLKLLNPHSLSIELR